ncbi:MAG: hypothetical protein R2705_07745 [Ilumatobacteraceae bacterium]
MLDDLETTYDAVGDVLVAEAVFQTTLGNYERAGAALGAIDKQQRPPDPEVIRTPRSGHAYTQKVVVALGGRVPQPWRALSRDARAAAAPAINAWAAQLLPDPAPVSFAGRLLSPAEDGSVTITELTVGLGDLGLSPASLVLCGAASADDRPSELESRVASALADTLPAATVLGPSDELVVLDDPPGGDPDAVGLGAMRVMLDWMRALLLEGRPAVAEDLALPGGDRSTGIELGDLRALSDGASATLRAAVDGAASASGGTAPQLRRALSALADLGIVEAVARPGSGGGGAALRAALDAQLAAAAGEAARRLDRLDALVAPSTTGTGDGPTERDLLDHERQRLRAVFGDGFPVVPTFRASAADPTPPMFAASLADREALSGGDTSAIRPWIDRMGLVRPAVDGLSRVLTASELLGGDHTDSVLVAQLPHVPGQRWLALPDAVGGPADAQLTIVVHAPGGFDPGGAIAALVIDEWNERIPAAKETTGVTFHFDAPGARAPQTVLLAVPRQLGRAAWDLDTLVATVTEAAELAKLRGVAPKDLTSVGHAVPMVHLPDNFTKDRPSVDLFGLLADWKTTVKYLDVIGKGVSL